MNRYAKAAMKRTGKPYGGHINKCRYISGDISPRSIDGRSFLTIATGNLDDNGRYRFGKFGNHGFTTSYIIKKNKTYIETRNTIYTYTEVNDTE